MRLYESAEFRLVNRITPQHRQRGQRDQRALHLQRRRRPAAAAMATFAEDCLPPEGFFESREALFKSINAYAKPRGYAFITRRSGQVNGFTKVIFACDRSRHRPSSPERPRQRQTTTRMTKCPFSIVAKESREGWTLKHRQDRQFATHNHEPSLHPSAHLVLRQFSSQRDMQIAPLSNAGLAPKEIQTLVRQSGSF